MVVCFRATANGELFEDTKERGKPIVFTYGSRPFTGGICRGVEEALGSMRAGGHALHGACLQTHGHSRQHSVHGCTGQRPAQRLLARPY